MDILLTVLDWLVLPTVLYAFLFLLDIQSQTIEQPMALRNCENYFYFFSTKTYVVGTQKNRLDETVLLSNQNTCFN